MPIRLIVAYLLIALLAAAFAFGIGWMATRRGRLKRLQRQRRDAERAGARTRNQTAPAPDPS